MEKLSPGMSPRFLSQNIEAKEPVGVEKELAGRVRKREGRRRTGEEDAFDAGERDETFGK